MKLINRRFVYGDMIIIAPRIQCAHTIKFCLGVYADYIASTLGPRCATQVYHAEIFGRQRLVHCHQGYDFLRVGEEIIF